MWKFDLFQVFARKGPNQPHACYCTVQKSDDHPHSLLEYPTSWLTTEADRVWGTWLLESLLSLSLNWTKRRRQQAFCHTPPATCTIMCRIYLTIHSKVYENTWTARKQYNSVKNDKIFQCIDMKVFVCRTSLEDSSHSTPSPLSSAASSQARHPIWNLEITSGSNQPAKADLNWVKLTPGLPPHCPAAGTRASCCSCSRGKEERTQVFSWKVFIFIFIFWKVNFSY